MIPDWAKEMNCATVCDKEGSYCRCHITIEGTHVGQDRSPSGLLSYFKLLIIR